jgi:2-phospho-L-lactate guanylyltransferase
MKGSQREVCAIIPVKNLDNAKSRLSPLLQASERKTLCLTMLEDILYTVKSIKSIRQIVVVSSDPEVEGFVKAFDVIYLEEREKGLNQAVCQAIDWCSKQNVSSVLILPMDIPLVRSSDLQKMLALKNQASMIISPSRSGDGTNALVLTPPAVAPTFYGPRSFHRHVEEASRQGISLCIYRSERIALDIDTIKDLIDFMLTDAKEKNTYRFLDTITLARAGSHQTYSGAVSV